MPDDDALAGFVLSPSPRDSDGRLDGFARVDVLFAFAEILVLSDKHISAGVVETSSGDFDDEQLGVIIILTRHVILHLSSQ